MAYSNLPTSPSGKTIVPNEGPLDAEIVIVAESPASQEILAGRPLVGPSGKLLNSVLSHNGIDRTKCRIVNLVPVRAPKDKFDLHSQEDLAWGRAEFQRELKSHTNAKVYLTLGANPTEWLLGTKPPVASYGDAKPSGGFITQWRGSVIKYPWDNGDRPENYLRKAGFRPLVNLEKVAVIPTFHPAAILRQYTWHPWFMLDISKAAQVVKIGAKEPFARQWFINEPRELARLCTPGTGEVKVNLIAIDTEMSPDILAIVTELEVHVFERCSVAEPYVQLLLTSPRVLKVAHNWTHDYAWIRKKWGINVKRPIFDTQGGAFILNTSLEKSLSPHIATQFTDWPYHKWMVNIDPLVYCGLDTIVTFDAYWEQVCKIGERGFMALANHDHKVLMALMEMQTKGFAVNEEARGEAEIELNERLQDTDEELQTLVEPLIDERFTYFHKPHLFKKETQCPCCGGGKLQRVTCVTCSGYENKTVKEIAKELGITQKAVKASLVPCRTCKARGKAVVNLPFNNDSPDQLADVIYRGLRIRPRKFKGVETVKAAQLDPIKDKHPVIGKIVECSKLRADYDTVVRLRAGPDGRLHCVFDPWGTGSGRIAGKEGLVDVGTNPMNLPKAARRLVVPDSGYTFLYPDMSQIEARAVAVLSKDPRMLRAFKEPVDWPGNPKHGKVDSHTYVQKALFDLGLIISRDGVKRLVYAWMYGGRAQQVAVEINAESFRKGENQSVTTESVQLMMDVLSHKIFPDVHRWQQSLLDEVLRTRKLRCPLTGREFTWSGYILDEKTKGVKYEIAKQVWSRLPQNLGAYILSLGLLDICESPYYGTVLQPLIHVHDALLIQVPTNKTEQGANLAVTYLSRTLWGMEFPADMKRGLNWYQCS